MPVMTFLADSRDKKRSAEALMGTFGSPVDIRTSDEVLADARPGSMPFALSLPRTIC